MDLIASIRAGRLILLVLLAFATGLAVATPPAGARERHAPHAGAKDPTGGTIRRRAKRKHGQHRPPYRTPVSKNQKPTSPDRSGIGNSNPADSSASSGSSHSSGSSSRPPSPPSTPPAPPSGGESGPGATPGQPGQAGALLFNGSFASGLGEWYEQAISSRVSMVPGNEGGQAARFEVREGDIEPQTGSQRAEVVAPPMFDEGQDLYIHDEIRVPAGNTYNAPWQIIQQLHEDSSENSPGVAVFLEDNHSLEIASGDSSISYWNGPVLQTERWYDLTYRVLLSQNSQVGTVEVWLDGVPQRLVNGSTTIHGPTATAARTFFKAGVYRSRYSTGTSIVEHDDLTIGSSLAAVEG